MRMLLSCLKPIIKLFSSSSMRLSKKAVPSGDSYFTILQFAAVGLYAYRQAKIFSRFYILSVKRSHSLQIALNRILVEVFLYKLFDNFSQKQGLDYLIASHLGGHFRKLLVKRQRLVLNYVIVEK